jgi:hypothetical protein
MVNALNMIGIGYDFFFKFGNLFGGGFLRNCFSIGKWFGPKNVPQPFFVQTTTSFLFSINVFFRGLEG